MYGRHEEIGSRDPLTEAQIHGILSAIHEIRRAEELLETKLREVGLNPWATNVSAHGGSKRGIIATIEATLELEIPAAAQRREASKTSAATSQPDIEVPRLVVDGAALDIEVAREQVDLALQ